MPNFLVEVVDTLCAVKDGEALRFRLGQGKVSVSDPLMECEGLLFEAVLPGLILLLVHPL